MAKRGPKPKRDRYVDKIFSNTTSKNLEEKKKLADQGYSVFTFANKDSSDFPARWAKRLHRKVREYLDTAVYSGTSQILRNRINQEVIRRIRHFQLDRNWELTPDSQDENVDETVYYALFRLLLTLHQNPGRLKKCPDCKNFHWDRTHNLSKKFCSDRCRNRVAQRVHFKKKAKPKR